MLCGIANLVLRYALGLQGYERTLCFMFCGAVNSYCGMYYVYTDTTELIVACIAVLTTRIVVCIRYTMIRLSSQWHVLRS